MARRPALGSIFVLTLNALTAIGEAGIYSTSQMKYYREVSKPILVYAQTTMGLGCKPIVVRKSTTIGS